MLSSHKKQRAKKNAQSLVDESKRVAKSMAKGSGYGSLDVAALNDDVPSPFAPQEEIERHCTSTTNNKLVLEQWAQIDRDIVKGHSAASTVAKKREFLLARALEYKQK